MRNEKTHKKKGPPNRYDPTKVITSWKRYIEPLFKHIRRDDIYRQAFFPQGPARPAKWEAARDLCLELFRDGAHLRKWRAEGVVRMEQGRPVPTEKWTSGYSNPVSTKVTALTAQYHQFVEQHDMDPAWRISKQVPKSKRKRIHKECPFYFRLHDLINPERPVEVEPHVSVNEAASAHEHVSSHMRTEPRGVRNPSPPIADRALTIYDPSDMAAPASRSILTAEHQHLSVKRDRAKSWSTSDEEYGLGGFDEEPSAPTICPWNPSTQSVPTVKAELPLSIEARGGGSTSLQAGRGTGETDRPAKRPRAEYPSGVDEPPDIFVGQPDSPEIVDDSEEGSEADDEMEFFNGIPAEDQPSVSSGSNQQGVELSRKSLKFTHRQLRLIRRAARKEMWPETWMEVPGWLDLSVVVANKDIWHVAPRVVRLRLFTVAFALLFEESIPQFMLGVNIRCRIDRTRDRCCQVILGAAERAGGVVTYSEKTHKRRVQTTAPDERWIRLIGEAKTGEKKKKGSDKYSATISGYEEDRRLLEIAELMDERYRAYKRGRGTVST